MTSIETNGLRFINKAKHTLTSFRWAYSAWLAAAILLAGSAAAAPVIIPAAPSIGASAYLLQDFQSGQVLAEENADQALEPASITKLMTAYIVFEELRLGNIKLTNEVLISEKAWRMQGSRTFVEVGKRVTVETLLKGMIIQSGNDATVALAEYVAGSEEVFATVMNQWAESLGMSGSHFVNSTGMPHKDHYMTARDIATLSRTLIQRFPEYYKWYSIKDFTYNGITQSNRNRLLWRDRYVDGIKTGHTESAGFCLVASALKDDMRLISVVLGTKSEDARASENGKLLNYGFRFFGTHRLYDADQTLTEARVWKGAVETMPLGLSQDLYVTIPRGQFDNLTTAMDVTSAITAPTTKGGQYGSLTVSLRGEDVAQQPLIALQEVGEGGIWQRLTDSVLLWFE